MYMNKIGKITLLVSAIVIFLGIGGYIFWQKGDTLTKAEAQAIITNKYPGEIIAMKKTEKNGVQQYQALLENNNGVYQIALDAHNGTISQLQAEKIKQAETKENLTEEEAVKKVTSHYKGTLQSISSQTDNGAAYFMVTLQAESTESTYKINRQTGEIEKLLKNAEEAAIISEDKAKEIAEEAVNGKVTEAELEEEDQQLVYEIELETAEEKEVKVYINAYSSTVLSINWEDD